MSHNIIKLMIGIIGIIIAVSCAKETPDLIPDDSISQQTELRSGDLLQDFFRSSLTIYDYENQKQVIINRDSLDSISFVRVNQAKAGKTELINNVKYTAGIFRVLFHFKTSDSDLSGVYYLIPVLFGWSGFTFCFLLSHSDGVIFCPIDIFSLSSAEQ